MFSHPELGSDPPIGSDRESGCDNPYMVWYRLITIRFLTRTRSFHELLIIFMSYTFIILYYIF